MNAAIKELLSATPIDELVVTKQENYYSRINVEYREVCDIVREGNKVIMLIR